MGKRKTKAHPHMSAFDAKKKSVPISPEPRDISETWSTNGTSDFCSANP